MAEDTEDRIELDMSPRTTTGCRDCDARVDAELPGKCATHRLATSDRTGIQAAMRQPTPVVALTEADLTKSQATKVGALFHDMAVTLTAWAAMREANRRLEHEARATQERASNEQAARLAAARESNLETELDRLSRETRGRQAGEAREVLVSATQAVTAAVTARDVVIGAQAVGAGGLTGWVGHGELTRGVMAQVLNNAGFHEGYLPNPKSVLAHAGFALQALTQEGRVVRADRGGRSRGARAMSTDGQVREFAGRWIVGQANVRQGQVGDAFGEILLTVVVFSDGRMECTGDPDLGARVHADYIRRRDEEVYPAAEVTVWLRYTLMSRFRAIRMGGCWFIPAGTDQRGTDNLERAQAFIGAVQSTWGADWLPVPFLPLATSAQLLSGLTVGLAREVKDALTDLASQRAQAQRQGQADIGSRGAATVYKRLEAIAAKARGFADMLGQSNVAVIRSELQAAIDTVKPLCDDISLRYAQLEL